MARGFKSGGRARGTPNRVTRDVRALANTYTAEAIATLIDLMRHGSEQVRLAASRELLDRAVGRPAQHADIRSEVVEARRRSYKEMTNEELQAIIDEAREERKEEERQARFRTGRA
jgi:hypothetical protein